jgi:isoquinoline 1-oxidoreductase alpha subunit
MLKFKVNGQSVKYDGDGATPLLWVLRDALHLTGTKYGCGAGLCGACTVHIDGSAARSCVTPVAAVAEATITTIEGLGAADLHPVQVAWIEQDVAQCGYCQAGQVMAAADLIARFPNPTDAQIDEQQTNLCRCGTYARIRKAIHRAAELSRQSS